MLETISYSQFPDLPALSAGLNSIFNSNGIRHGSVTVVDRKPMEEGSFPKEVVTCQFGKGTQLQIFCKYQAGFNHNSHNHRGGLAYEVHIYETVLKSLNVPVPRFYGSYTCPTTGDVWLVLEYLSDTLRLNQPEDPEVALRLAAAWLGEFHRLNETRPFGNSNLYVHDAEYYLGWSFRTAKFARDLQSTFPWLAVLCKRFEEVLPLLLETRVTLIHGEYYPRNILFRNDAVYPVDWESAAIASGEIDFAALTDGWPQEAILLCKCEYQQARWPQGVPTNFENVFDAALLYTQFRWLGEHPKWTIAKGSLWRFEQLQVAGERLGLI